MTSLAAMGLVAAMVAQDPGEILGGWGGRPEKAMRLKDPDAEAAEEKRMLGAVAAMEKLGGDHLLLADPLEELGGYYLTRKRATEAGPLFSRALAIREKNQGRDHVDVAGPLIGLTMTRLAAKGKDDGTAEPMLRRALAILEPKDRDDPEVARALHITALMHLWRREFDAAESDLIRALAIHEKTTGRDSAEAASLLDDLGDVCAARAATADWAEMMARIEGRPGPKGESERSGEKAEGFYKRALAIREKVFPPDDPHIAESLFNVGQLAVVRERPEAGEPYLERWLKQQEAARAPAGEPKAKVYVMLARASMRRKDWAEADRRMSRAQEVVEVVKGPATDEAATMLESRANVALSAGRFDVAETFLRQGLQIQAAVLGAGDPDLVEARTLMAGSYRDHVEDRRAPLRWHRLAALGRRPGPNARHHALDGIASSYDELLRQTNRVVPKPTDDDLAFLKKAGVAAPNETLEELARAQSAFVDTLDDAGLLHIARLYDVENLTLGDPILKRSKPVTDAGLKAIKDLMNLRMLSVGGADITDAGLAHLAGLEELEDLALNATRVGDAGLVHLKGLKNLRELNLAYTKVTDAGLKDLEGMPGLRSLDLSGTVVTEGAVQRLRRARPDLKIEYEPGPGFIGPPDLGELRRRLQEMVKPPSLAPGRP